MANGHATIMGMRVLLTGASGLLGRAVAARLSARGDMELTCAVFSRSMAGGVRADLTDPTGIASLFAAARPEFVIHAAAERRPDVVDGNPAQAAALNVRATENLAQACAGSGAFLLYISTDYVFDGRNPPYFPDSPVNPLNEYGRLKLEGERRVATALPGGRYAILRLPILYGRVERLGESAVTELASNLAATREPRAVEHWAKRYPLHVDDAAAAIGKIIDSHPAGYGPAGRSPIYLLSGRETFTKYEMVLIMAEALGIDPSFVVPDPSPPRGAPRPRDCRMDTSLLESLGYRQAIGFREGIADAIAPFFQAGG